MRRKNSFLIFSLIFLLIGCTYGLSRRYQNKKTVIKDRNLIIRNYLDKKDTGPPLEVDIIYARQIENQGWDVRDYKIEFEDVLDISVWEIEKLKRTTVVRPDGKISFPLVGEVQAEGVTIEELRKELSKKLTRYIRNPQVSVTIKKFGGKRATVIRESGGGRVLRFTAPLQILEAVAMSGGYTTALNLKKIYVVRQPKTKNERTKIIVVDAQSLLRNGDVRENIYIQGKDIVFLARGWLSSVTNFRGQIDSLIGMDFEYAPHQQAATFRGPRFSPWGGGSD